MTVNHVEQIADAILYEGYNLYPYRAAALKNQQRWLFGVLYPEPYCARQAGSDDWRMRTECLVSESVQNVVAVNVRFLHLVDQRVFEVVDQTTPAAVPTFRPVASLQVGQDGHYTWQQAVERSVAVTLRLQESAAGQQAFSFPATNETIALNNDRDQLVGQLVRDQQAVQGIVEIAVERCDRETFKVRVTIENQTRLASDECDHREHALLRSLVSTHTILTVEGGEFVSLLDPPDNLRESAEACRNAGTWPVLAGEPGSRKMMLSSPIILPDYPRIAPESLGDLFDGTEIDELLLLRIQTLTDKEQREMAGVDERTRQILERTQTLDRNQVLKLHGTMRPTGEAELSAPPRHDPRIRVLGVEIRPGSRVRLRPRSRADAFDLVLNGMPATVRSIEVDFEDNVYVAVTVDDDPGQDLGCQGKPGHRFFFRADEIEPLGKNEEGNR